MLGLQVGFEQGEESHGTKRDLRGKTKCNEQEHYLEHLGRSDNVVLDSLQGVKSKLNIVCNEIGLLKSLCRKFVNSHIWELVEELSTTDDVRTICVNTGACE